MTAENNWHDFLNQQREIFFNTANDYLQDVFSANGDIDPKKYHAQIEKWLAAWQKQWDFNALTPEQKMYLASMEVMMKAMRESSTSMLDEWIKEYQAGRPIKNSQDLYLLWIKCGQKALDNATKLAKQNKAYQELANATYKFWESMLTK